ncbi:MAG: hypothetical protein WBQ69_13015 [Gallionella sp.]
MNLEKVSHPKLFSVAGGGWEKGAYYAIGLAFVRTSESSWQDCRRPDVQAKDTLQVAGAAARPSPANRVFPPAGGTIGYSAMPCNNRNRIAGYEYEGCPGNVKADSPLA